MKVNAVYLLRQTSQHRHSTPHNELKECQYLYLIVCKFIFVSVCFFLSIFLVALNIEIEV